MWNNLRQLNRAELLSFKGVFYFTGSLLREGINLMAVVRFSAKRYPNKHALVADDVRMTYSEMYVESKRLMAYYKEIEGFHPKQKVGLYFPNSASCLLHVFALSRLGMEVLLINTELSPEQVAALSKQQKLDQLIIDRSFAEKLTDLSGLRFLIFDETTVKFLKFQTKKRFHKPGRGSIGVMSGGTSGNFKAALRKPSVFRFLAPLLALLTISRIHEKSAVIVTAPLFHGFGLSTSIVGFLLGKKVVIQERFTAKAIISSIENETVEVLIAVPTIIQRLLEENDPRLNRLETIFTGGTRLSARLSDRTLAQLGPVLYNLYGSSEGGFSFMATPADLTKFPGTIGKPLYGVKVKIDENNCLQLKGSWKMTDNNAGYYDTKDLCSVNEAGCYFINGRYDDMIISGGENVHPQDVHDILITHESIRDVAVLGIPDETFGERLVAFIVVKNPNLSPEEILSWLKPKVARFQVPREIVIVNEIPMLNTGKLDKKKLLELSYVERVNQKSSSSSSSSNRRILR